MRRRIMLIRPFTMRITAAGLIAAVVGSGFKKAVKIPAVFLLGAAGLFLIASAVRMLLSV